MALNIVALLMVLAIIFIHSIFGFFSGVINVFCSIVSLCVALGFFEALNGLITGQFELHPGYTEPICLVGLFIIAMIVTRTLADNYIRGNVRVPMAVDWGGAAVCGFVNAQIFVGVLILGVSLLPLRNPETGTILQYAAFARDENEKDPDHPQVARFQRNHLWTRPDEFAVGLFNLLSGGSLRGKTVFASVYPDFTEAAFFSTNTVQPESTPAPYRYARGRKQDGFERGLAVEEWWEQSGKLTEETRYRKERPSRRNRRPGYDTIPFETARDKKLVVTKLRLDRSAADRDQRAERHLFRPTMIRLVGRSGGKYKHYVPRILGNADGDIGGKLRVVDWDDNFSIGRASATIYAYFEVDEDFRPAFVEYRRHARAPLPAKRESPGGLELTAVEAEAGEAAGGSEGKRTFGSVLERDSGDWFKLPFAMSRRALDGAGVTLDGNKLASGRVFGARRRIEHSGEGGMVEEFKLPEGKRLVQIRYKPKQARTIVGDVFNYVAQVNQYFIRDKFGNTYPLVGYYAIVKRSGEEYIELFYAGGPDEPTSAAFRGMLDFKELDRKEINDQEDTIICLLFLVPPNTELVRVENQAHDGGDIKITSRG